MLQENGPRPAAATQPTVGLANLYFLLCVLGAVLISLLQARGSLAAVVAAHLSLFVLLPLLLAPAGFRRQVFRLRPVPLPTAAKALLLGALAWVVAQALAAAAYFALSRLGAHPPSPYRHLLESGASPWLLLLVMAGMPALTEEFAFRGLVLSGYARLGGRTAWVGAGLLFAFLHLSLVQVPALAFVGMVYSFAALRTGSLVPGALMHLVNNTASLLLLFAGIGGEPAATGPMPAGALLYWLLAGAGALLPLLALLRTLEPGPGPTPPPDPEPPFSRWWPLLPAGLLVGAILTLEAAALLGGPGGQ